jgi:hypothetical protein
MWALDELGLKYERVPLNTQGDSRKPEYLKVNPNGQGLRQSHLTYYYPTRVDLLAAAGRAAIDAQLATADAVFDESSSEAAAAAIAKLAVRHETTRVMMALAQAADQEPQLRALFRELGGACRPLLEHTESRHHRESRPPAACSFGGAGCRRSRNQPDGRHPRRRRCSRSGTHRDLKGNRAMNPVPSGPLQDNSTRRITMTKLVLIVGAGPVGMTMASELARYGVAVRIVTRRQRGPTSPRPLFCGA